MIESVESLIPHLGWLSHPPGDEVARFLAEGWFEYREQAFCWMYLREGDTVIDAGAHFGLYASLAGRLTGASGHVLAVEANPVIEPCLAENLARHARGRGKSVLAALSSGRGEADFFIGGGGRAAYSSTVPEAAGSEPSKVRLVTMDDLCREGPITGVALAKVDVEGDEIEVLRGARDSIASGILPLWLIEFAEANLQRRNSSTRVLFEEIASLGYTVCRFDELHCRLAPVEWKEPVWYENYFAATAIEKVNQRLSESPAEHLRVARDILRRGAAATALREEAGEAKRNLGAVEVRAAVLDERLQEANHHAAEVARRMAVEKDEAEQRIATLDNRAAVLEERLQESNRHVAEAARQMAARKDEAEQRISAEKTEAAGRLETARKAAEDAARRADEINAHLEESWRRIGEANWRADQAVNRAETAAERGEAAYRRLEVAHRRAAAALYEAALLKMRLRELLLHPRLAKGPKPEWAESFLRFSEGRTPQARESDSSDPMHRALYHLSGKDFRPRTVLDVGAGKGYWSLNAHSFFPDAEYHMIEPLDENQDELRHICEENSRFHFLQAALGDVEGCGNIHVTPDLFSSSCLPAAKDGSTGRQVRQRTADALVQEGLVAAPDLIKIDVQGYELKVLAGAENVLKGAEVLIVEVNLFRFMPGGALAHEVIGFLAERGFVLFDLAGSMRRPFGDDLAQIDFVFAAAHGDLVKSTRWA